MKYKYKSKLTEEEKEKILELGRADTRIRDIVEILGGKVTKQRVYQILLKHGINPTAGSRKRRQQAKIEQLEKRWGKDYTKSEDRKDYVYQTMREKFRVKKANAVRSGKEWSVDFGELVFPEYCPILGIKLDYFSEKMKEDSVSFDRIDSSKGYISGNVLVVSWRANRIKNDGTAEEHKKIYEFMQKTLAFL